MQNILFITSSRIGDTVLSTGLLDYLIKLHPHSRITVAVGRITAELFQSFPNVNRVLTIDKRKFGLHWLGLRIYQIRCPKYDFRTHDMRCVETEGMCCLVSPVILNVFVHMQR